MNDASNAPAPPADPNAYPQATPKRRATDALPAPERHPLWGPWMEPPDEAAAMRLWAGPPSAESANRLYTLLNNQMNVIYVRAQTLMTFAGLIVTVTGFSGRTIAQTSRLAQMFIVSGMALVLLGAMVSILWVMRIRWLSWQMAKAEGDRWIVDNLRERNRKVVALRIASLLMVAGFLFYGSSIGLMLMDPHKVLSVPHPGAPPDLNPRIEAVETPAAP